MHCNAQLSRQSRDYLEIGQRLADGRNGGTEALNASLDIGKGAFLLSVNRRRELNMS